MAGGWPSHIFTHARRADQGTGGVWLDTAAGLVLARRSWYQEGGDHRVQERESSHPDLRHPSHPDGAGSTADSRRKHVGVGSPSQGKREEGVRVAGCHRPVRAGQGRDLASPRVRECWGRVTHEHHGGSERGRAAPPGWYLLSAKDAARTLLSASVVERAGRGDARAGEGRTPAGVERPRGSQNSTRRRSAAESLDGERPGPISTRSRTDLPARVRGFALRAISFAPTAGGPAADRRRPAVSRDFLGGPRGAPGWGGRPRVAVHFRLRAGGKPGGGGNLATGPEAGPEARRSSPVQWFQSRGPPELAGLP